VSATFRLYVVDEAKLPTSPDGTDRERYDRLVEAVPRVGALWAQFEMKEVTFNRGLVKIDQHIGARKFLPIFAFNNSPKNVLGDRGDCPAFGYFTPKAASDLATLLGRVPAAVVAELEEDDISSRLFHEFKDAALEARRRGHAIAVLHNP
jgi:hypothetical protein